MLSLMRYTEVTATQARISALGTNPGRKKKESHIHAFYPPFHLCKPPPPHPVQLEKVVKGEGGGVMSLTMCVYVAIAADHQHIFSSHMVPSLSSGFKRWIKREHPVFSVCFFFFFLFGWRGGRPFLVHMVDAGINALMSLAKASPLALRCTNFTGLRRSCTARSLALLPRRIINPAH